MQSSIRFLPFAIADGPTNMAADEAMLLSDIASLRFYGWSSATLSLGYFQPAASRIGNIPWIRRATGGQTLVHDHELTYALALPAGLPWQTGRPWMRRMHEILQAALGDLGVEAQLAETERVDGDILCFEHHTVGDLLCHGKKIGGSAQRKHRRALLQHGSILLRQSEWTPSLPGVFELTGIEISADQLAAAIGRRFTENTGWPLVPGVWTDEETRLIARLAAEKFGEPSWNGKR